MQAVHDLIVVGGGPAGANAALAAAEEGLHTLLLDGGSEPGGQVWRAPATQAAKDQAGDGEFRRGEGLRRDLAHASVTVVPDAQVWSLARRENIFELSVVTSEGVETFCSRRLVLAPGAVERVVPFEGWTLPGVLGLAAATVLLKTEKRLPGRRVVIAGQGPLLMAVAAGALASGLCPVAVVDHRKRMEWVNSLPGYAAFPGDTLRGMTWAARVALAGCDWLAGHRIIRAHADADGALCALDVVSNRDGTCRTIAADTLFVGDGLSPDSLSFRLLGAQRCDDPVAGGMRVAVDDMGRTSVPGLYAAGDGAAIRGARTAVISGRLAGLAVAEDALSEKAATARKKAAGLKRAEGRATRFARASCRLMRIAPERLQDLDDSTILCRCENVRAGALRQAVQNGAGDINQIKHFTRVGMGPCQGRSCMANVIDLVEPLLPAETRGQEPTARPPLRPLPATDLIGEFDYEDIPIPKPAPL